MNAFKALYIKELKDNRSIFLFVLMAALALHAYGYTRGVEGILPTPYIALAFLPVVAVFVLDDVAPDVPVPPLLVVLDESVPDHLR